METKSHIVIIGVGFGGISAAKELRKSKFNVTLIDRTNHHLFQPLLYQVATAALSPGDIAAPIRTIVGKRSGIKVVLGQVEKVNPEAKSLTLDNGKQIFYDTLILSPGARYNYFGNDHWEKHAPGLKSLSDALKVTDYQSLSSGVPERLRQHHQAYHF